MGILCQFSQNRVQDSDSIRLSRCNTSETHIKGRTAAWCVRQSHIRTVHGRDVSDQRQADTRALRLGGVERRGIMAQFPEENGRTLPKLSASANQMQPLPIRSIWRCWTKAPRPCRRFDDSGPDLLPICILIPRDREDTDALCLCG
jgi:hypothetical protein